LAPSLPLPGWRPEDPLQEFAQDTGLCVLNRTEIGQVESTLLHLLSLWRGRLLPATRLGEAELHRLRWELVRIPPPRDVPLGPGQPQLDAEDDRMDSAD